MNTTVSGSDQNTCAYAYGKLYFVCNIGPIDFSINALTFTEKLFSTSSNIYCHHKVITLVSFSALLESVASQLSSSPDLLCSHTLAGLQQAQGKHSALPHSFSTYLLSQDGQNTAIKLLHVSHTSKHYICPLQEEKCHSRRPGETNRSSLL